MKLVQNLLIVLFIGLGVLITYLAYHSDKVNTKLDETEQIISEIESSSLVGLNIVRGEKVYVPVNSNLKYLDGRSRINLSISLNIRNTDPNNSLIISYVDYYNSEGKLSKKFLQNPVKLKPMATVDYYIAQQDTIGGSGANFFVEWVSDTTIFEPVIEALMVGALGNQAFSWKSEGIVVASTK